MRNDSRLETSPPQVSRSFVGQLLLGQATLQMYSYVLQLMDVVDVCIEFHSIICYEKKSVRNAAIIILTQIARFIVIIRNGEWFRRYQINRHVLLSPTT